MVKHFPGHGSASADTHEAVATATATKQEFDSVHLPPFRAAISAGVEGVMVSHVVAVAYDAKYPASLSEAIVTDLLRGEMGFDGLVVTDDLFMAAASGSGAEIAAKSGAEAQAAVDALNAGCDLLILSEREVNSMAVLDALVSAIERGEVSQSQTGRGRAQDPRPQVPLRPHRRPTTAPPTLGVSTTGASTTD